MNGTYVIRNSYLTSDNKTKPLFSPNLKQSETSTLCSLKSSKHEARPEAKLESPRGNSTHSDQLRAVFSQAPYQLIGRVQLPGSHIETWVRENVTCAEPKDFGLLCGAMVGESFVLANTTRFESRLELWSFVRPLPNVTMAVIRSASGAPVGGMRTSERRIRFLASLAGSRLLTSYLRGDQPSQRLITRDTVEQTAFMIMSVANEEGIGGVREEQGFRSIKSGEKQSATMKRMAFIPIGILLCSGCSRLRIRSTDHAETQNNGVKPDSTGEVRARTRVKMSMQWFSERVSDDLRASSFFQSVSSSDVSAKHVVQGDEEWFQLLPLSFNQHQHGMCHEGC